MAPAPVVIRIRRRKSVLLGLATLLMALLGLGFAALILSLRDPDYWLIAIALLIGLSFGGMAAFFFGIARQNPVALRMDAKGVSGYYITPATWDEIGKIGTFTETHSTFNRNSVQNRFLGFELHDPIAFRDSQTAWGRLRSWSSGRGSGYHLTVPENMIAGHDLEDLETQAQAFHAAYAQNTTS